MHFAQLQVRGDVLKDSYAYTGVTAGRQVNLLFCTCFVLTGIFANSYSSPDFYSKVDLGLLDELYLPFCDGHHWSLIVIDVKNGYIREFDSMSTRTRINMSMLETLVSWLKKRIPARQHWQHVMYTDAPQQKNTHDCGIYVCMFADLLALRLPLSISASDITNYRKLMVRTVAASHASFPGPAVFNTKK